MAKMVVKGDGDEPMGVLTERVRSRTFSGVRVPLSPPDDCPDIFADGTGIPMAESAIKSPYREAYVEVCIPPVGWLRLQMAAAEAAWGEPREADQWLAQPVGREENTRDLAQQFQNPPTDIPKPFLELDGEGNITSFQEGRNRGVGAYYAGVDAMPVYIILDLRKNGGIEYASPPPPEKIRRYLDSQDIA